MADQNITALPAVTTPESSDQLLLVGATEEKLIDYDKLADAILGKIASKNFALDQGNKTLLQALNELNSNQLSTYLVPEESSVNIELSKGWCYLLAVKHSWAGTNIYAVLSGFADKEVSITPLHEDYQGFSVKSIGIKTIVVSQKDTGGDSNAGLLRIA